MNLSQKNDLLRELFKRVALGIAEPDNVVVRGTAEALVNIVSKAGPREILNYYFLFEAEAIHETEIMSNISKDNPSNASRDDQPYARIVEGGLRHAAEYATNKQKGGDMFAAISSLFTLSSRLWRMCGTYQPEVLAGTVDEFLKLLDDPLLQNADHREGARSFFGKSKDLLSGIHYSTDEIPLSQESLSQMLVDYPTREAVVSVLSPLLNLKLYPLASFRSALDRCKAALKMKVAEEDLFMPDQVILDTLLRNWTSAVESDRKYKAAALHCEAVGQNVFIPIEKSPVTLRLMLSNVSDEAYRVGEARNIRISVKPPLVVKPRKGFGSAIPVILSWETNVRYDLLLEFPDFEPGIKTVKLQLIYDDLTGNDHLTQISLDIKLQRWEERMPRYDSVADDERDLATEGFLELEELLQTELDKQTNASQPIYLDQVEKAIERLSDESDRFRQKWDSLEINEKRVAVIAQKQLADSQAVHLKMTEIINRLNERYPNQSVNWIRSIKDLVRKNWLLEENGLYRFRASLLEVWVARYGWNWLASEEGS